MSANESPRLGRTGVARNALAAFALLAAGALPGIATATEALPAATEEHTVTELERAFWACDYVATTEGVSATPIAACKHATEALRRQKFGDDFEAFLSWWRQNKAAEHLKMHRLGKVEATL
jgi:hypothetical protein